MLMAFVGAWIAAIVVMLGGIAFGAAALYTGQREANAPKPIEPVNDPEFGIYQGYVCPVWSQNNIERELGGTDFMHCDNTDCPGCYEHGKCAVAECNDPGTQQWFTGHYRYPGEEWLCGGHYNVREIERDQRKAVMAEKKREAELVRVRVIGKHHVDIPVGVPEHAYGSLVEAMYPGDCDQVMWEWMDTKTGKRKGFKQVLPPEIEAVWKGEEYWHEKQCRGSDDWYTEEIHDGDGTIIKFNKRKRAYGDMGYM
jgi:hypothetical protein